MTPGLELEELWKDKPDPEVIIVPGNGSHRAWAVRSWCAYALTSDEALQLLYCKCVLRTESAKMERLLSSPRRQAFGPIQMYETYRVHLPGESLADKGGDVWFMVDVFDAIRATVARDAHLQVITQDRMQGYGKHSAVWTRDGQAVAVLGVCHPPREWAHDISEEGLCVPC